ncbi:vanadium-dependent haloperoxidase [Amycolatopsis sp. cmx-11-12]|uniref:vanadium-dependent haloperoxidase n=1 Tax=Amycolatopsis sp. cmx-11-12 TaxID=2785795 RepID=UPI003917FB11
MKTIFAAVLTGLVATTGTATAGVRATDVTIEWFDATAEALAPHPDPYVTQSRNWAVTWLGAARAARETRCPSPFAEAAVASAVHTSLRRLAPEHAERLDARLTETLQRLPDGPGTRCGVEAGRTQAIKVFSERENDGLDPVSMNAPFPTPVPGPGVWQPTPPGFREAKQAGFRKAQPFLLDSASQFRPGPPPTLDSVLYRHDLAEVARVGAVDSEVRTRAQTDTAAFWYQSSVLGFTGVLRAALAESKGSPPDRARLVATFHVAAVDTEIAVSDAKYAYLFWRPVTALRSGSAPEWTPLHVTPAFPEYPSGHSSYAGSAERILTVLRGPIAAREFQLTSPTAPSVVKTYRAWCELTRDNIDARVWSGIHFRHSDNVGAGLGGRVASNTLAGFERLLS